MEQEQTQKLSGIINTSTTATHFLKFHSQPNMTPESSDNEIKIPESAMKYNKNTGKAEQNILVKCKTRSNIIDSQRGVVVRVGLGHRRPQFKSPLSQKLPA